MSSLDRNQTQTYWRSLDDLADAAPELKKIIDDELARDGEAAGDGPLSRRRFMQIMGASLAFASMAGAGCRWEKEEIIPLGKRPDNYIPGKPKFYATAMELGGVATGLVATAYDGRPTKIEGNPQHPSQGGGATTGFAQASVLNLYDPDRSRHFVRKGGTLPLDASWKSFQRFAAEHFSKLAQSGGRGLRFLSEAQSSPTVRALRAEILARFPQAQWHEYEPLSRDNEREGTRQAFGAPMRVALNLTQAKVIAAFDSDFLIHHPAALKNARDFARGRRPDDKVMNRLYCIESAFTATGSAADHRLPLRSDLVLPFLLALEARLARNPGASPKGAFLAEPEVAKFLKVLASDLLHNRGKAVVTVGPRQPATAHAAAARINALLAAAGRTVVYYVDEDPERVPHTADITRLCRDAGAGKVHTLVILGGNPVFNAPVDAGFKNALAKIETSIHLSDNVDETSSVCTWHIPRAHYLEAWGDGRAFDGTYTLRQPILEPLWGARSDIEVLAAIAGKTETPQELVRKTLDTVLGPATIDGTLRWRKAIHDGFVPNTAFATTTKAPGPAPAVRLTASQNAGTRRANGDLEVVLVPSTATFDGRFANNGWLQEMPDFMTKLTWDNAALMSPKTAAALGIHDEDVITIKSGGRTVDAAVYLMPGQAPFSIALAVGYGRTHAGYVGGLASAGIDPPGVDVYPLSTTKSPHIIGGISVSRTGRTYKLVGTQDHWKMDKLGMAEREERAALLIREATLKEFKQTPNFVDHMMHVPGHGSLWQEIKYDGHKWGMATDLAACIGCNSCTLACQAENNVPVVGKDRVAMEREMHWLRIDRYFRGDPENPTVAYQPVGCQQCENAPCESVCPVGATVHSSEGLNDMTYNRCVGTRYCANNCPYKVRRFNFFNYREFLDNPKNKVTSLQYNPEVTVRSRGVMEKCTFCVQRIQAVKIASKNDKRPIRDGEIVTACQQACPTDAIVFGDLNDEHSRVRKLHESPRAYAMLEVLYTRPRNNYLARIRNPHEDLS
ncbi:MAG TPA: TAT-variant-translocated molybdopterin oxidoreductase [Kofleriaceae bacterium]|nr:TAT-variant-translocated molybdopterin oxidoreductase [Kofleriaceae bacterium]